MVYRIAPKLPICQTANNRAGLLNVNHGGTGTRTGQGVGTDSVIPYAPLVGGINTTYKISTVSSAGIANQVLASNGAGVKSTYQGILLVQRVSNETGAVATGTTTTPYDDTIPQSTEGTQFLSQAITPKNTNNILVISTRLYMSSSTASSIMTIALHQDSAVNALSAMAVAQCAAANFIQMIELTYFVAAGTTSATTFKIRIGGSAAATLTVNGQVAGRIYGGKMCSNMMITEYSS